VETPRKPFHLEEVYCSLTVALVSGQISTNGINFILQPGTYQAHLSIGIVSPPPTNQSFNLLLNGTLASAAWLIQGELVHSGDRLFSVTAPNTSATLQLQGTSPVLIDGTSFLVSGSVSCALIITQLH
jgi:hypothetical protein